MQGVFVTLEGADGCGKSTQAGLLAASIVASGRELVRLREPGGTAISEKVRALLLDPANSEMCPECELLLFEASRAQLVRQVIEPALAHGAVVLCDRFYDSTYAYQAAGRSLDEDVINAANALGSCGVSPQRTIVLDMDTDAALVRAVVAGADRMEAEGVEFQRRVRAGYLHLADAEPDRVRVVDADGTPEEVFSRVASQLEDLLGELVLDGSEEGAR